MAEYEGNVGFKVEEIKRGPSPKHRRVRMTLLLWLVLGWAAVLSTMERSGAIAKYFAAETLARLDGSSDAEGPKVAHKGKAGETHAARLAPKADPQ